MTNLSYIEQGNFLYRYDIIKPPAELTTTFVNPEYSEERMGERKNQAGLFFFFSNEEVARNTAKVSIDRNGKDGYWLTEVKVKRNLLLLNLALYVTQSVDIIDILLDEGIPVFDCGFVIHEGRNRKRLDGVKQMYGEYLVALDGMRQATDDEESRRYTNLVFSLKAAINDYIGAPLLPFAYLGQVLTDFENGSVFKSLLAEKKYDGYVFDESKGGHTVCLLNADDLQINKVELEKCQNKK